MCPMVRPVVSGVPLGSVTDGKWYGRAFSFRVFLTDEALEKARPEIHEMVLQLMEASGGVLPNEFVDNDLQAADHVAQDEQMAVTALVMLALRRGLLEITGTSVLKDGVVKPLP